MKEQLNKLFSTGFFHIFGSNVINKIISFLSSIILVRILTKSEYGVFSYAWNIYSIVILASGCGMESAILQMCSEKANDTESQKKITNFGARGGLYFNVILCLLLAIIGVCIPLSYDGANTLVRLLCFLPIFQLLYALTCVVLRCQKRNKEYAKLTVINTVVILLGSVIGAFLFHEKGMVIGYYLSYTVSIFVGNHIYQVKLIDKSAKLEKKAQKDLISIAAVSMINNGISELLYLLDVFILGIVASEETILASYKVATIIPTALNFIPISLMIYLYPYFAEHNDDGKWCMDNYKKIVLIFGGMNLIISLVLFFGAGLILQLVFGNQYLDAVPVFRLLSVNYFISGTFRIISGNLLVTQRKLKFNAFVTMSSGLINAIADYYFIQRWGSIGAAIATILVVFISSVMSTSYLLYSFKTKSSE